LNDGTDTETVHVTKTVIAPVTTVTDFPADPVRDGYHFAGWNLAADGSGTAFTAETPVNGDITVYAKWQESPPDSYVVTFMMNDGTENVHVTKTVTVPATTIGAADFPDNPSRDGHNFGGWNLAADGLGAPFTASTPVSEDITVYAIWQEILPGSYAVSFRLNDGTQNVHATKTVTEPATTIGAADFPADPVRDGYRFDGWNTAADGLGTAFTASTSVSGNITVHAKWTGNTYTVTFRMNDGTDKVHETKTVAVPATTLAAFPVNPSRDGHNFGGWNTAANGSGTPFTASTPVSGNITVYAKWQEILPGSYAVSFRLNDGTETVYELKTVTAPATTIAAADFPADPSRTGYNFGGWNTAVDGSGTPFTAATTVSDSITVYATWAAKAYTVTFMKNDGTQTVHATKTVTFPATTIGAAAFPADPSRSGHSFGSWNTAADGLRGGFTASTPVSGDITVYAIWTPGPYTVTFRLGNGPQNVYATRTVTFPATTLAAADFPDDPPVETGFSFGGWNTLLTGMGDAFTESTPVNDDIVVFASLTLDTYDVTFMLNDGTEGVHATKTVAALLVVMDPTDFPVNPSRTGYNFGGWNAAADGLGDAFTASTSIIGDIMVYAQWTATPPGSYAVAFRLNDSTETVHAVKTVTAPATAIGATDFPAAPSRAGHSFDGWNTAADGSETPFTASTTVSGDITVYAAWTAHTYTVTFKLNDGTQTNHAVKTVTAPATTLDDFPDEPSRSGHNFGGWNAAADGSGDAFSMMTPVSGDITVYAQWIVLHTYTVVFKLNDGTENVHATETVTEPSTTILNFPAAPYRAEYLFGGWNTDQNGGGRTFSPAATVNADITVYARWDAYSYTVTFDNDNGTTPANPSTKTVASPSTTIGELPGEPAKTGYHFGNWYTEKLGGGTAFTGSTPVSRDIRVYAKWNSYSYTVSFDSGDGATAANLPTKPVASPATTVGELPGQPAKTGYTFGGWVTDLGIGGTPFTASTTVSGSMTVYARWTANTYTVTFMRNDGTQNTHDTKTVTAPETTIGAAEFPANPSRANYNFGGWNTAANGSGDAFTASTTVSGNGTVYAQWTEIPPPASHAVTFKLNDGTENVHVTKTVTEPATTIGAADFPGNPVRAGYDFAGWNTAANGLGTAFTASTTVSGPIPVYATWTGHTYTVTFDLNAGTDAQIFRTITVPATTIPDFPPAPSRLEYMFSGWNTEANGSGSGFTASTTVSGSITVYAQWSQTPIIINPDAGSGAFEGGNFTLSKSGTPNSRTVTVAGTDYESLIWYVDGIVKGTGMSLVITASDYTTGGHWLTLFITRNGVTWSKDVLVTIAN
jgi:uncharacterized repeat protein (TIGR02543 family)